VNLERRCRLRGGIQQRARVVAAYAISGLFDLEPLVGTSINNALHLDGASKSRAFILWRAVDVLISLVTRER
jgi:hypothetical protein